MKIAEFNGTGTLLPQLTTKHVQMGYPDPDLTISYPPSKGPLPIKNFYNATHESGSEFAALADSAIGQRKDLKGKKIGVPTPIRRLAMPKKYKDLLSNGFVAREDMIRDYPKALATFGRASPTALYLRAVRPLRRALAEHDRRSDAYRTACQGCARLSRLFLLGARNWTNAVVPDDIKEGTTCTVAT